jgi:hypothetical protein
MIRLKLLRFDLPWPVILLILGLAVAAVLSTGCQRMEKFGKHWESGTEGLNRTITLYDDHGGLLGRWNAKTYVELKRGEQLVAFLDSAGHEVKLVGGIVVVQEH